MSCISAAFLCTRFFSLWANESCDEQKATKDPIVIVQIIVIARPGTKMSAKKTSPFSCARQLLTRSLRVFTSNFQNLLFFVALGTHKVRKSQQSQLSSPCVHRRQLLLCFCGVDVVKYLKRGVERCFSPGWLCLQRAKFFRCCWNVFGFRVEVNGALDFLGRSILINRAISYRD